MSSPPRKGMQIVQTVVSSRTSFPSIKVVPADEIYKRYLGLSRSDPTAIFCGLPYVAIILRYIFLILTPEITQPYVEIQIQTGSDW
jgi:hypothetical protein